MKIDYSAVCMAGAGLTLACAIMYKILEFTAEWFMDCFMIIGG